MAVDNKYGKVTLEHGNIGEDEVVVVFRATDELLPIVLSNYWTLCQLAGSPTRHLELIRDTRKRVVEWQKGHKTRTPNSESSRTWLEG